MKDVILGTAGHIDHGKTALVQALTGMNTDRLKEEKARGITIDIGFAHLQLGDFRLGFIDVPGHEKFVKNMLAGIGGIRFLLLVIAANESVMPQTREHFEICRLLDLDAGIIVITKCNLVDEELRLLVEEEARELVAGSKLETAPLVFVDSLSGDGIDRLQEMLLEELKRLEAAGNLQEDQSHLFRLPVDRVFTIKGFGTVITGTPIGGVLKKDSTIRVYPGSHKAKVRRIEIFNQPAELARAGQRTALNLVGLERGELERGMILSDSLELAPSQMFDVALELLESAPKALKHRSPIRFHLGSAEIVGRIYFFGESELEPGQKGLAQIRLESPILAFPIDRFVLRRYSPMISIGGGLILDNAPRKHRRPEFATLIPRLETLSDGDQDELGLAAAVVRYVVEDSWTLGRTLPQLMSRTGYQQSHLEKLLQESKELLTVPQDPLLAVSAEALSVLETNIHKRVENFHRKSPLATGISKEEIKRRFMPQATPAYFQFVLDRLQAASQIRMAGSQIALFGRETRLADDQEELRQRILDRLRRARFRAPTFRELVEQLPASETAIRQVYYYLLEQGELVRISSDIVLTSRLIEEMEQKCRSTFANEPFTVTQFKELLGVSRKYAIPLLEHLDRNKVTRRIGDQRTIL